MKPSREFTIKVLSNEDFDNLPYPKAKESFGMSVMDTKTAYVRKTGVKEMDQGTIEHEFDELMSGTSLHEENGIRYKSGGGLGKILGPIVGTIVGVVTGNPAIGAAVAAAIGGGTQAHSQSVKPEKYGSGFGGIAKSGFLAGLGGYGGASLINAGRVAATNAAIASAAGQAVPAGVTASLPMTAATFGAGVKGATSAAFSGAGSAALSGAKNAISGDPSPQAQSGLYGFDTKQTPFSLSAPTAAFAPQAETALNRTDFDKSLESLGRNAGLKEKSIFDQFRGKTEGNSAFDRNLAFAKSSAEEDRTNFLDDQKKLGSTFV